MSPLRRWELPVLLAILAVGAALRLVFLSDLRRDPLFAAPALDAQLHDYWAWGLASGEWRVPGGLSDPETATTPYFRPPGYAHWLAAIYRVAGRGPAAPRIFQFGLGLASCLLGWLLARRSLGPAPAALLAGLLAVYWVLIYFEGQLVDPVLLVFLVLALMLLLRLTAERPGFARAAAAGAVLGLAALVRPNVLAFAPAAAGWLAWVAIRRGERRALPRAIAGLALGALVAVAPATLRNRLVAGEWVLISTNGGINLWVGNNPEADGVNAGLPGVRELIGEDGWTCFDYPRLVEGLGRKLGRPLGHAEASRVWAREAASYIASHPARFLALTARRAALFWGPNEIEDRDVGITRRASPLLRAIPLGFPVLLALAVPGAFLMLREPRGPVFEAAVLAALLVAVYFLSFLPFFFNARYRVPVLPLLMLFAAFGLHRVTALALAGKWRAALVSLVASVVIFGLASVNWAGYEPREDVWHYQLGNACRARGEIDRAMDEYRAALRLNPVHPAARNDLAVLLLQQGRVGEAARELAAVLEADPSNPDARFNLGNVLARQGRLDEAIAQYRAGLEANPLDGRARMALGTALLLRGDPAAALGEYRRALELRPADPLAHTRLADALAATGRLDEAVSHYQEALRLEPGFALARQGLEAVRKR